MKKKEILIPLVTVVGMALAATGCTMQQVEDLKNVGKPPQMAAPQNPVEKEGYQPISWPSPPELSKVRTSGSLWQQGSKSFFKDHRARAVGDIVTVMVDVQDSASLDSSTERSRTTSDSLDIPSVFGLQKNIRGLLKNEVEDDPLIDLGSSTDSSGQGKIDRAEKIQTKMAAVVTQVMPNGNMAIYGSQEIRVNSEVRQVTVEGIVRPEDISSGNTVDVAQLAEARVSYGGKGDITSIQRPRIGQQVVDILSPF